MKIIECIDVSPFFLSFFILVSAPIQITPPAVTLLPVTPSLLGFIILYFSYRQQNPQKTKTVLVCLSVLFDSLVPNIDVNL